MPLHTTACPLDCPDACGVLVETDERGALIRLRGNPEHPYSRGVLCSKTNHYHERVLGEERLTRPLLREGDGFRECSWEEAVEVAARRLAEAAGPDLLSLEYAGSMGLVARQFPRRLMHALGATTHDSGVCDNTSTAGFETVLGQVIGPDILEAQQADGLVLWGCDAKRTVAHLFPMVKERATSGVPVCVVDIYRTDTVRAVERWGGRSCLIRPGSDSVLASALGRAAFEGGHADREFLARECLGFAEYEEHLRGAPSLEEASKQCDVSLEDIEALYQILQGSQQLFLRTGSGWTRRRNGAMGMRALCSLSAVLGQSERVHYGSGGVFPFRNEVITRPDLRPAPEPPVLKQVQLGKELLAGRFRAAVVWGHNPALTLPDSQSIARGFRRDDFFLLVHEQVMTETAKLADLVLPATMFVEHADVYRSYGHRVAQYGRRAVEPPEGPKSNVEAFALIGRAMGLSPETWEVSEESLCEEIMASAESTATPEQMRSLRAGEPTVFEAPKGSRQASSKGSWGTPSGKIELVSESAAQAGEGSMALWTCDPGNDEERSFWLVSAPSKDTHNTTFLDSPRHSKRAGAPRCFIHPDDIEAQGLEEEGGVRLHNKYGALTLQVSASDAMPRGLVRIDGFPEPSKVPEGVSVNVLSSPRVSDLGDGITYFSTRVDLEAAPL